MFQRLYYAFILQFILYTTIK